MVDMSDCIIHFNVTVSLQALKKISVVILKLPPLPLSGKNGPNSNRYKLSLKKNLSSEDFWFGEVIYNSNIYRLYESYHNL